MGSGPFSDLELRNLVRDIAADLHRDFTRLSSHADWARPIDRLPDVAAIMTSSLERLAGTGCWGESNRALSHEFWGETEHWLRQGSLQTHARLKPAGYAGDYRLFDRICRQDATGVGVGYCMDLYFLRHAAPCAVRNRTALVAQEIRGLLQASGFAQKTRIISIGSGPAWELRMALHELAPHERARLEFWALDMDPHALDFVSAWVDHEFSRLEGQVKPQQVNLRRLDRWLSQSANAQPFRHADYVYCTGFLDYLPDDVALSLLTAICECLPLGCKLDLFCFGTENPSRAYMEWIGNWYVIHRETERLRNVVEASGLSQFKIITEPAGVNLVARCVR